MTIPVMLFGDFQVLMHKNIFVKFVSFIFNLSVLKTN